MDQEQLVRQIMQEVLKNMQGGTAKKESCACTDKVTKDQYPLAEKIPERILTPTGVALSDITLDKVISGEITAKDMRIAPETLEMQAQVAESVRRDAFASNLRRASELIAVPDARLLEIYNALRPYRSTKAELIAIGDELINQYGATVSGNFVKEAAEVYEQRGRLKQA